jgi:hypothetical protein
MLADSDAWPSVPDKVRAQAAAVIRHYPTLTELQLVHNALPDLFGPPPPFSRLRGNPQTDALLAASAEAPQTSGAKKD